MYNAGWTEATNTLGLIMNRSEGINVKNMHEESRREDRMKEYRQWLVYTEHRSSEAYDEAVMTLAGGALAISFADVEKGRL